MPFSVGLTGGVASGKSTVARLFARHNVPVIDADEIARELVKPGEYCLQQIVSQFGENMLHADGTLNRRQLRQHIFTNEQARDQLDRIMHPAVRQVIGQQMAAVIAPYCLVVIPLLLESKMQDLVDRVLVVDCPREHQLTRLIARDRIDDVLARSMLDSQLDPETRLRAADDIIDNSHSDTALPPQVERLHQRYLALSRAC